jgi:hypothetical protein
MRWETVLGAMGGIVSATGKRGGDGKGSAKWKMSEEDVTGGLVMTSGSGPDGSGGNSKQSRKGRTTSSTMTLIHKPTGVQVVGAVPKGHYSRAEMIKQGEGSE